MTRSGNPTVLFTLLVLLGFAPVASAHYETVQGRWLERDPIGTQPSIHRGVRIGQQYLDGPNLYQYARSVPTRFVDPSGWQTQEPTASEPAYDPRDDPSKGCGVTVRPVGSPVQKNSGHDWLEIDDPLNDSPRGLPNPQGIGFWPRNDDDLWNAPSKLYTPGGRTTENCECVPQDDPYTGTMPGTIWPVFPREVGYARDRDGKN